ncbi:dihydrofolate reductase family protein [Jiangella rhizosphaerae]|uniref:Dihydrofolate reductase n=1 Tax=Jiangella rhizosphaerae TaxID=2293569 RepID=A0A418KNA6_9ACTN|nr:dihydrofolate reductase family protein [Jiangella rhizosphaerae]RIQ20406.1 dihydrofolate reductase [Jiangella rhizosphaerae]
MRPLIVFSDVTLDGFMAGPANDLDFLVDDARLEEEFTGRLRAVADTIVFGRSSFAPSAAYWMAAEGELAGWMNTTPKVILSTDHTVDVSAWTNATLAAGDGVEQVRRLKESDGGGIVAFGGVRTVGSLVAAGLVDEYWLKINPVVVGRGSSMFAGIGERRALTLRDATTYPSGTIAAIYTAS